MEKVELENLLNKYKIKLPKKVSIDSLLLELNYKERCSECQRFSYLYPYCPYCGRKSTGYNHCDDIISDEED